MAGLVSMLTSVAEIWLCWLLKAYCIWVSPLSLTIISSVRAADDESDSRRCTNIRYSRESSVLNSQRPRPLALI